MSDRYVEKNFLYLLLFSALLHVGAFLIITTLPQEQPKTAPEPTFVDLTDLPDLQPQPKLPKKAAPKTEIKRYAETPQRVAKEMAPKAKGAFDRLTPSLPRLPNLRPAPPGSALPAPQPEETAKAPVSRGEGILKPRAQQLPDRSRLFPSANRLARLEESYREKYRSEVEEGETRFLNTEDIQFGSFLRRLETAVYGVWHYPQAALLRGIEGTTPVKITFNRKGEIVNIDLLESSGSKILDDEVFRALNALGPIGSFPKGYRGETFKLIAFFHYGNGGGRLR
ncbi:periplasmic energy transduction protein, TonB-related protein [Citrifermentans bemidjiense Bem]|uniref:Periplasmic energy transduction protein, TonB-related protein n=1 Tax=Citrifermentans bemidjiense (strain ATCC BAA-1014 / DSM 16622 / JCM 12645 / Bem) TaxID=404380 RepID=B5E7Y1_CITBB|nr:TonB family protein [Citrifermentans bemidjiense]ACH38517.1 periplasmic energy transduction protein, TonB-related protein [Citrifermentans bemidjiense Bem]